ncbi:monoacylglycerol/Diacylglycerol O-acyltransferase isoform X2 [Zootoca vivipara]|uniref:monoacylglycerol/Diacylglycerol O-acyltransferase isoform X2 n=1 Tax=Zootoca vivipara TaxID=8524 RepID=UPI001590067A|nr:monoacylglycerol/Diacylglycerol O-acyltransferase isoform X2 [Zootoca vivipara]
MSWFTQMLENWISFPYLEDYLTLVVHPRWFFVLLMLFYSAVLVLFCFSACASLLLYIYKKMNNHQENDFYSKFWDKPRHVMNQVVDTYGKIWHGIKMFLDVILAKDFTNAECVEILKKGHLLSILPGGAREGNFSNDYNLMWGNRTGFARIALEAKVPIIPIFTQNMCEAYRTFGKTRLTKWLYEKTRCIFLPSYGGFPVKLRTYVGEPIPYDPNITATELTEKAKTALENLRDRHQKRPGNILRALSERFDKHGKAN